MMMFAREGARELSMLQDWGLFVNHRVSAPVLEREVQSATEVSMATDVDVPASRVSAAASSFGYHDGAELGSDCERS